MAGKRLAAVLTIVGGVFYLIGGVVATVLLSLLSNFGNISNEFGASNPTFSSISNTPPSIDSTILVWGVGCAILMIVAGAMIMSSNAGWRKGGGILALLMMLIGALPDLGGLLVGFILTLIGAVMGLTYSPTEPDISIGVTHGYSAPVYAPPGPSAATTPPGVFCTMCGKQLSLGARFCKYCGSPVPQ